MKTKNIFKNKKILILGTLLCVVLVAFATMYETSEIDQYSGRTRISYQVLGITVHSYENDTEFSKLAAKYVVHPPKWKTDTSIRVFCSRGISTHYCPVQNLDFVKLTFFVFRSYVRIPF